jgi:hypothetical protein
MNKLQIELLSTKISVPIDVLIGCVSYEQRCLSVPSALTNIHINYPPLYFRVKEFKSTSSMNEAKLNDIFNQKLKIVEFSNNKPVDFVDSFILQLNSILDIEKRTLNIIVDISTFTRESLIMLIGVLHEHRQSINNLYLVYSPASAMSDEWLSRGFRGLRSVLGFSGEQSSLKPLHIVVMTGFEFERAKFIIDEYEPDLISIGIGDRKESIKSEFYERNKRFVTELVTHYETRVKQFSFSLINPGKVAAELDMHIKQFSEYNTVIAPLNNKVSTVGAALYCLKNKHVQICYLPAEEYNTEDYSKPDDTVYLEKFDFNFVN